MVDAASDTSLVGAKGCDLRSDGGDVRALEGVDGHGGEGLRCRHSTRDGCILSGSGRAVGIGHERGLGCSELSAVRLVMSGETQVYNISNTLFVSSVVTCEVSDATSCALSVSTAAVAKACNVETASANLVST